MRYPGYIEDDFEFPDFFHVRMRFAEGKALDAERAINGALEKVLPDSGIGPGHRVAVGVGSRGIANLPVMVRCLCLRLQDVGARPLIIPAMGSHGGATDHGQKQVLGALGVTEAFCRAPVCSSLAVERIGTVFGGVPVYFSRDALEADHSICINRIKAHTKFKAPVESGLFKMLCIGMGKHQGALVYHRYALRHGFFELLKAMGQCVLERGNVRFGVAVVEDARDETMHVEAVPKDRIWQREAELLELSKQSMPRLPLKRADVLVILEIGKEISGSGMDPNVTGRAFDLKEDDFSGMFQATRVAILNLSRKTGGNAIGLGNADIITEKVYRDLDYEATLMNALTSFSLRKAFIPVRLPNDRKAIQACYTTLGPIEPEKVRAVIVRDTLHLQDFLASRALLEDLRAVPEAEILERAPLEFDASGDIRPPLWLE